MDLFIMRGGSFMKSSGFLHFSAIVLTGLVFGGLNAAKVSSKLTRENVTIKIGQSSAAALYRVKVNGKAVIQALLAFYEENPEVFTAVIEYYNNLKLAGKVEGVKIPDELLNKIPAPIQEILFTSDGCFNPEIIQTFELIIDMINEGISNARDSNCKCSKSCWGSCCKTFWTKQFPQIILLSIDPAIKIITLVVNTYSKRDARSSIDLASLTVDLVITYEK